MSWGIAETAPEIEKIKAESADYLGGLNSCGEIEWGIYSQAFDFYADLIQKAYELGKTEAKPHWIPCSERLPKDNRQVLVYARSVHYALAKYDEMRNADGTYKKQWVTFDAWKPLYTIKEVIAWCELPEPYKGAAE